MITIILSAFALLALSFDYIILRRHIPNVKWIRILHVVQALVIDVGVLVYLVHSFFSNQVYSDQVVVASTWLILAFMMSFVTKGIFCIFSILEMILSKRGKSRYSPLSITGAVLALGALSIMVYGATIGRSKIRVEHVVLEFDDLPKAFDGFKIAQFSDAHLGNLGAGNPLISNLATKLNELNPDIVVQSGDLVNIHSGELNESNIEKLKMIKAPVFSVLGNHDLGYYIRGNSIDPSQSIKDLIRKQGRMGWTLLRNEHEMLYRDGDSIAIGGVVYPKDNRLGVRGSGYGGSDLRKTFAGVSDSTFSILISHTPALFDSVPETTKPRLTMSGHVHAMQTKITIGNWKWSPAKWLFPMWSGLWNDRGYYLYVNDGLGYALYPMRIGTRPEITLYELKITKN